MFVFDVAAVRLSAPRGGRDGGFCGRRGARKSVVLAPPLPRSLGVVEKESLVEPRPRLFAGGRGLKVEVPPRYDGPRARVSSA